MQADAIFTKDESPPDRRGRDCDPANWSGQAATGDAIKNRSWYQNKSFLETSQVDRFLFFMKQP